MSDDWLLVNIRAVEHAATELQHSLSEANDVFARTVAERAAGLPLTVIAQRLAERGAQSRQSTASAIRRYEHAVRTLRAAVIHAMVDEEGVSFTEIAKRTGISRQAATRLYQAERVDPNEGIE